MSGPVNLPAWADRTLVPLAGVVAAFAMAGGLVIAVGESPALALRALIIGSLGSGEAIGFTLYYATNFLFTGLAVAVAFHAGLFNIGAEGQATLAGIGAALACLHLAFLPGFLLLPAGILAAAAAGALYGFIPGYLHARRGSHVVITTIMLNFLASTLLVYLLVNVIGRAGSMSPETEPFPPGARIPFVHEALRAMGIPAATTPLNFSLLLALAAAFAVWLLVYRSRLGYAIRTVGANPEAANYAGISPERTAMIAMTIAGALAGGVAVNEIMGVHGRLILGFTAGYGFVGIAVALMGRSHPAGIVLASLLFGVLYQGGAELAFETPRVTRDMILVIGGIIILFAGALDGLFRRIVALALRPMMRRAEG